MLLKNKVAVITGCNKGIGFEILKKFSQNGADIFSCVRNINDNFLLEIDGLKKKYKNKIIPIELDLSNEDKVKQSATKILNFDLPVDILINNAATIQTSLFQMSSRKKLNEVIISSLQLISKMDKV